MSETNLKLVIAESGKSDYVIVIASDAGDPEKNAAAELQAYLEKITSVKLPILTDAQAVQNKEILVGFTNRSSEAKEELLGDLKEEGFIIRTEDEKIFLTAAGSRGTLYCVYEFLEKYLGCRFYTEKFERVPQNTTLAIDPIEKDRQVPVFEYRNIFWSDFFPVKISLKRKLNAGPNRKAEYRDIGKEWGGCITYAGEPDQFVHTFRAFIPPQIYRKEHPEYYTYANPGGKPRQICTSNPEVLNIVKKSVREWLKNSPDATIISVSQQDRPEACTCPECMRIFEEEGSHAGSLLRFINAIADDIKDDYPNVKVDTLAYTYSRRAPKITRAADNVIVRLCSIESCFSHPLSSCPVQPLDSFGTKWSDKLLRDDLAEWSKMCDNLYIWDYTTQFLSYNLPHPNFRVLRDNLRLFADNNVKGVFEQGAYESTTGEFCELRGYLLSKLIWNPYVSEEEYREMAAEFMRDYYGEGWKYVRAYLEIMHEATASMHVNTFQKEEDLYPSKDIEIDDAQLPSELTLADFENPDTDWSKYAFIYKDTFPNHVVTDGEKLFELAEKAALTEESKNHVRKSALQIKNLRSCYLHHRNKIAQENIRILGEKFFAANPNLVDPEKATEIINAAVTRFTEKLSEEYTEFNRQYHSEMLSFDNTYSHENYDTVKKPPVYANHPNFWGDELYHP